MKRMRVVKNKKGTGWLTKRGTRTVARARTKKAAVRKTAKLARKDAKAVSVRIYKKNGRIQEERTYPRKADPRRSKG